MVLGDDQRRVAEFGEHLDASAREPELALDRLIRVGHAGDGDHLRSPLRASELRAQQLWGVMFDENLRLEVEPGRESEGFVGRTRETVVGRKPTGVERPR